MKDALFQTVILGYLQQNFSWNCKNFDTATQYSLNNMLLLNSRHPLLPDDFSLPPMSVTGRLHCSNSNAENKKKKSFYTDEKKCGTARTFKRNIYAITCSLAFHCQECVCLPTRLQHV